MTGAITKNLRTFWANPVVTRDLRVRMRGSKSYWHQAFYLLLVGLLALAGYGTAVGWGADMGDGMSAVEVQQQLQSFYYFIFITLAALITLIAPALTAVAITTERQRLSLDLLVTTPLSASELLVGKMISSVAFLALLLALSLPASALCVILGGATLGDVVRVYLLLAIDGLVMAAIGLAISCTVRASLPALVWSYAIVIVFLILTAFVYGTLGSFGRGTGGVPPAMTIGVLDPFIAVIVGAQSFSLFGASIPLWVGSFVVAFVLIRLLVTAATYRLGRYGGQPIGSLRRQLLLVTALIVIGLGYSLFQRMGMFAGSGSSSVSATSVALEGSLIVVFLCAAFLLPSLFTPATLNEDDPPGLPVRGAYSLRRAFRPEHAGALPFFHLWLLTVLASAAAGVGLAGAFDAQTLSCLLLSGFYLSGLGFLFWAISRRAVTFVTGITAARALTFIFFAVLVWLPIAALSILFVGVDSDDSLLAHLWLLYPLLKLGPSDWTDGVAVGALCWTGLLAYGLGVLAYPPWRAVVPGGRRRKEARHVPSV